MRILKEFRTKNSRVFQELTYTIVALLAAFVIGGVILAILQYNPFAAYGAIFMKAFTDFGQVLRRATPLMLTALAVAIPYKCGMFNLGGEGQLLAGAFAAAVVGSALNLPMIIHSIVAILAAAAVGMVIGIIPAWLKIKFGASEIVVSLMMNYVVLFMLQYLTLYKFSGSENAPRTAYVAESAMIGKILPDAVWTGSLLIAIATCIVMAIVMSKTTFGLELKSAGLNREASEYLGINVKRMAIAGMAIGAALAGVGGGIEVLGGKLSYYQGYFDGVGFDGVAISYMAMGNPIGIIFTSLIISAFKTGVSTLERTMGISTYFNTLLQGIIITMLVSPMIVHRLTKSVKSVKRLKIGGRRE